MREIALFSTKILVQPGLIAGAAETIRSLTSSAHKALLLCDRNTRRYARPVAEGLKRAGIDVDLCLLPPGETQKKPATAARLYDRMARFRMERKSILVAVGGGVVTDLGGFVASTYMRGIPLFLVPTTLLGQVDAAIGGKTGVNLAHGKNLIGTFYQPKAVLLDPAALATLPDREFTGGLGEVIKYGMIQDAGLLDYIERNLEAMRKRDPAVLEEIVFRCATIKAAVVGQDEKEYGLRAILNYGHTVGHALETAGGYVKLHHGEAISIGMEAEAFMAMELGLTNVETLAAQNRILKACGLPTRGKGLPQKRVLQAMQLDKKGHHGRPRFVLPEAVGRVRFEVEVPDEIVVKALRTVTA